MKLEYTGAHLRISIEIFGRQRDLRPYRVASSREMAALRNAIRDVVRERLLLADQGHPTTCDESEFTAA